MSRSIIACLKCRNPLAVKHHSGRVAVCGGVKVVIVKAGNELTCRCGAKRLVVG